ncbi:MAG: ATP-binding cassette domain-containing protein [Deltaproteobacteria bacterium]|nr:ATP-binding cassette domain-containing protein [Deltaproteobacteria bacterium]
MIKIENISKTLGEFFLKDLTLDIENGTYFMILGPTGAGKTILLESIAGIYYPDKGRIRMGGKDITNIPPRERNVSMVYQDYMLFPHLSVKKNIAFGMNIKKLPKKVIKEKVDAISQTLNIHHLLHRFPGTLSGGEKQRIAIARAMMTEPKALLLDEPLSALDAQTREGLRYELKKIHSDNKITIVHVTHNFEEVFSLADSVAVMREGEIIQVGNPDDVFRRPNCEFIANFVGVENLFKGRSTINNGTSDITINGIKIVSTACNSGDSVVSIRPEDILVSRNKIESSARNSFSGNITGVIDKGAIIKIVADCGIPISAIITRRSFDDMGLSRGMSAYFTFKASDVHFI